MVVLLASFSVNAYSQTLVAQITTTGDVGQTGTIPVVHSQLKFTAAANKTYAFRMKGGFVATQNYGFKWVFTGPSGVSGNCYHMGSNAYGGGSDLNCFTEHGHIATSSGTTLQVFQGTFTTSGTGGDIEFAFCQQVNSGGNPATVKKNFVMEVWEMP